MGLDCGLGVDVEADLLQRAILACGHRLQQRLVGRLRVPTNTISQHARGPRRQLELLLAQTQALR